MEKLLRKKHLFHYAWVFIIVILLVFIAVLFATGILRNGDGVNQVARLTSLSSSELRGLSTSQITDEFSRAQETYHSLDASGKAIVEESLYMIAAIRKEKLVALLHESPEELFPLALSSSERAALPPSARDFVEQFVTREGIIEVIHSDFEAGSAVPYTNKFVLYEEGGGLVRELLFAKGDLSFGHDVVSGSRVEVSGLELDESLVIASGERDRDFAVLAAAVPDALGRQDTIVLLVNFQDTQITGGRTVADIQEQVFTGPRSANEFYKEVSYQKTWFSGSVLGWYTLPLNQGCVDVPIRDAAIKAADADVFFPSFKRLVLVVGTNNTCGLLGSSTVGRAPISTGDGTVSLSTSWIFLPFEPVFYHELGHGLGMWHANGWDCGVLSVWDVNCASIEYADPFDIMGRGSGHPNARHKELFSWFDPSHVIDIDITQQSGSFFIEPIEVNSPGAKYIRLRHPEMSSPVYSVEYRRPIGFDNTVAASNAQNGAVLHMDIGFVSSGGDTQLIDATPNSRADPASDLLLDSFIPVGTTWVEPAFGFSIRPMSAGPTGLSVNISKVVPSLGLPPKNLHAVPVSLTEISVFWQPVDSASGYQLFRKKVPGDLSFFPVASPLLSLHLDSGLSSGTYSYIARYLDGAGIPSAPSLEIPTFTGGGVDSDGDGFSNFVESYLGTNAFRSCPLTTQANDETVDSWPPDLDDTRQINILDVLTLRPSFNTVIGSPSYNKRADLKVDGRVNILDILSLKQFFGANCIP